MFYLMLELHDEVVPSQLAKIIPGEEIAKLATSMLKVNSDRVTRVQECQHKLVT